MMRSALPLIGYWLAFAAASAALYWGTAYAVFFIAGPI